MPPITLPGTGLPEIPDDEVYFSVEIDHSRCVTPPSSFLGRLTDLETKGFQVPLSRLIAFSSLFYEGVVRDPWKLGADRLRITNAWWLLYNFNPRRVVGKSRKPRMVLDKLKNPSLQRQASEVLGVGAGMLLARHIYGRPYRAWRSLGNARMDYTATTPEGRQIKVEVRGRFNRSGWGAAIDQVKDKITKGSEFNYNAGIIFAPRTLANPTKPDFLVMDPENETVAPDPMQNLRNLLLHYAQLFLDQGFPVFGSRLIELASLESSAFDGYLKNGDEILRRANHFRSTFSVNGVEYRGTAWSGIRWPNALTNFEGTSDGVFFDGLATAVIESLITGNLHDIDNMTAPEKEGRLDDFIQITIDDGRALAWAPTLERLLEHP